MRTPHTHATRRSPQHGARPGAPAARAAGSRPPSRRAAPRARRPWPRAGPVRLRLTDIRAPAKGRHTPRFRSPTRTDQAPRTAAGSRRVSGAAGCRARASRHIRGPGAPGRPCAGAMSAVPGPEGRAAGARRGSLWRLAGSRDAWRVGGACGAAPRPRRRGRRAFSAAAPHPAAVAGPARAPLGGPWRGPYRCCAATPPRRAAGRCSW
jgi:hypothetical protein